MSAARAQIVTGAIVAAFGLALLLLMPYAIPHNETGARSPSIFPEILAVLLLVLGAAYAAKNAWRPPARAAKTEPASALVSWSMVITVAACGGYVFLLSYAGYWVAAVATTGFLLWYFGVRRWITLVALVACAVSAIYGLFAVVLKFVLP